MKMPAQRAVAAGMTAYVRFRFRPIVFGLADLRLEPGTIVAPNHRSDNDVPVLVAVLYPHWANAVERGVPWPTFAADDHAFLKGFLGGYPEHLPLWLRRLLWPIRVGGVLERHLQCVPVREPTRMRLVEVLRADPKLALDGQLPSELRVALGRRPLSAVDRPRGAPTMCYAASTRICCGRPSIASRSRTGATSGASICGRRCATSSSWQTRCGPVVWS